MGSLVEAAAAADGACVKVLMASGRPSWQLCEQALIAGVEAGSAGCVYELTKRSVDSRVLRADGWNNAHIAAAHGRNFQGLLEQGGLTHALHTATLDAEQLLPLHIAIMHGQTALVQVLLASDASIEATDARGRTPLMHAIEAQPFNKPILVRLLKSRGQLDTMDHTGRTPMAVALQQEADTTAAEILMEWKHQWATKHFSRADYDL